MIFLWTQFLICAFLIFYFGEKLALYGEKISHRLSISAGLVGFIFLAIITSLPEVFTGIGSVTIVDVPDFAIGDAFGSMLFNLLIIGLLEFQQSKKTGLPILVNVEKVNILTIFATNLLLIVCFVFIFLRNQSRLTFGFFNIGFDSFLLIFLYVFFLKIIFNLRKTHPENVDTQINQKLEKDYLWPKFALAALVIIIAGFWLAKIGKEIVSLTNWNATIVGTVFLAIATSLPEVFVSIAALRLGLGHSRPIAGINMAIGNILGSNFFDVMIIPLCDIFYRKGEILSNVAKDNNITILFVVIFGSLIAWGIKAKNKRVFWRFGLEIMLMLILALFLGLYFIFKK
jgi:cation:H+ antiporter